MQFPRSEVVWFLSGGIRTPGLYCCWRVISYHAVFNLRSSKFLSAAILRLFVLRSDRVRHSSFLVETPNITGICGEFRQSRNSSQDLCSRRTSTIWPSPVIMMTTRGQRSDTMLSCFVPRISTPRVSVDGAEFFVDAVSGGNQFLVKQAEGLSEGGRALIF